MPTTPSVAALSTLIKTSMVATSNVKGRARKGYTSDLVSDIHKKLAAQPSKAYEIRCEEPLSPRHLANVLRQRIGKQYVISSNESERAVWIEKKA